MKRQYIGLHRARSRWGLAGLDRRRTSGSGPAQGQVQSHVDRRAHARVMGVAVGRRKEGGRAAASERLWARVQAVVMRRHEWPEVQAAHGTHASD